MAKNLIKMRFLRRVYPGLFGWALNAIICILVREGEGDSSLYTQKRRTHAEKEVGAIYLQTKELLRPPEAERVKKFSEPLEEA